MPPLPVGTVSFLFTDVEDSTRLLERYPEALGGALGRHHDLLNQAVESNGGTIFETLGDGAYAAFDRASNAVKAAIDGQRLINAEDWGQIGRIRVRMGMHTGDVQVRGQHYFGAALFRCARLMAIGHGGQILLSRATFDLVHESLPPEASLRPMGLHRLKDLGEPSEVFQLVHPDLQAEFPRLKSLEALANNLPVQATRLIGREREVGAVRELVSSKRLVTISGAGGAGKTRIALQVAADLVDGFEDGVWLVEMAPLADPSLVPQAVATVLSLREDPGHPPLLILSEHLRSKNVLLLFDSCEHVVAACAALANALLRASSRLHILVTSRESLAITGETTWRVPSLTLPPPPPPPPTPESLVQYEAIGLFVERAAAARVDFHLSAHNAAAVLEICSRLDGIPLAIELAAARVRMLSVEQIAARLDDRFRLLSAGNRAAMPRQQTLRAMVDWSYELLGPSERVLFRRLSAFAGGWTLEPAEQVCAFEGLESFEILDYMMQLVDKSLVIADEHDDQERYRMLETIRQYARDRLAESEESAVTKTRHLVLFLALVEGARPEDYDAHLLSRLDQDFDNLRAALRWAIDSGDTERALRLAGGLWDFWSVRGYYTEGRAWLKEALAMPADVRGTLPRARALQAAGHLANLQADYATASVLLGESRNISEELGNRPALAASLHLLGNLASSLGDLQRARTLFKDARRLNRDSSNTAAELLNLLQLADVTFQSGDYAEAGELAQESLRISRERRQQWGIARAQHVLGRVAAAEGDLAAAARLHRQSLVIQEELLDQQGRVRSLAALARVAQLQGDTAQARARYAASLRVARDSRELLEIARGLEGLAELDAATDPGRALRLAGAAGALRKSIGAVLYPEEQRRLQAWQQPLYVARSEKQNAEARALGRAMSLDEAIDEALALR